MKTITKLGLAFSLVGAFCYAENWNGKLIDASCYDSSQSGGSTSGHAKLNKACPPTASTTAFAIQISKNKVYKLDSAGNSKAVAAMQSGVKSDKDGDVHVSISGALDGQTVKLDTVEVGKHQ